MIPEIIENGVNGFISNDEDELKQYVVDLLNDEDLAKELGEQARKTIVEKFSQEKFIKKWDTLFRQTAQKCFRG
jgi:glycosyltransferase involved in cell wall biosynthesis